MVFAFALLAVAVSLELLVSYRWPAWFRKLLALASSLLLVLASAWLLAVSFGLGSLCIALVSLYSIINLARTVIGRADERYLRVSAVQTAIWLGGVHVLLVYYLLATHVWAVPASTHLVVLAALQLGVALGLLLNAYRQSRRTILPGDLQDISDSHLPTVTVAVPVRNEAGLLEDCLTSILASNYPKLEVLAFDDHSHDKTPEIIRSFAHAGVRFIRTSEPAAGWLAKNQAYDSLAKAANGEYILFCGADVRLGVRSIRNMVGLMAARDKRMAAFLPLNQAVATIPVLQAMRYYWEMAPPRRLFNRPPVLSSCWIIERKALQRYGGFAAFRQSVSSEAHLAQSAVNDNDGYSFMRSDDRLAVTSQKARSEQQATARLRRYSQAHRRPELVLVYTVGQTVLLLGPAILAILALPLGYGWPTAAMAGAAFVIHTIVFGRIQRPVFPLAKAWRAYAAFVPAIVTDVWYLNQSMLLYEFATVTWKDRNVSRPVMRQSRD